MEELTYEEIKGSITVKQLIEDTGFSRPTIEKYIKQGLLKAFKVKEGRAIRITKQSVEDFFEVVETKKPRANKIA